MKLERRALLFALSAGAAGALPARAARATSLRGLSLSELVRASDAIAVVTPLDARASYDVLGGVRRIVTDTRVRVEEVLARKPPRASELVVRTLGGRVGDAGELVHGEAVLVLGETSVAFLKALSASHYGVTGMAQGHFPLRLTAGRRILLASPRVPKLRDAERSARRRLSGLELAAARALIRAELAR